MIEKINTPKVSFPNKAGALSGNSSKVNGNPPFTVDCPIRTELLAHSHAKVGLAKQIPIDQLLKIERVAVYLEGKGKQPNTIDSFRRRIAVLARHANLYNPQEVELAIARLKLTDPSTKKQTDKPASNTYKAKLCFTYQHYVKFYELTWEMPHYIEKQRGVQPL